MNFSMTDTTHYRLLHRHLLLRSCAFLLFAALLLLSLSACGQRETHQDYGSAEELHYSAVHTVLPYYDAIQAACAAEDTLYYVSAQQTETGVLPTRLYHFDPAAGESVPLESFDESRKAGDTGIVENDGNYIGYHVMYFVGTDDPYWMVQVRNAMMNKDYSEWSANLVKDITATENSGMKYVG